MCGTLALGKMRHLMWQVLTGCIATTKRLAYRNLDTDRSCPRCDDPEENINHFLFECPRPTGVCFIGLSVPSELLPEYLFDTLQLASIEAECWRKANLPEDGEKNGAHIAPSANSTLSAHPQCPTYQIDASWFDNGTVSGLGWFYNDQMGVNRFVLQGCRKSLSALHAELEGFIWAMSCLREVLCTTIHMETVCSDLVA
ncbi:uncharacterized protein LOC106355479 [Brassica napus]|uniref:uncharacterized protein LOC106355479 n=1 Tax=Brassica napus TaxID=3708 RepID=UPI0006AA9DE9|nr:uncharacterized protein LOC106355479 [Brassica napus]